VNGQPPVIEGDLHDSVNTDECFWNISDGKLIEVTLQKVQIHFELLVMPFAWYSRSVVHAILAN